MCFKNLPVEFDAAGRPRLREDAVWRVGSRPERPDPARRAAAVRDFDIDPVTRVAGALSFHTAVDLSARSVVEARVEAPMFRGYEVILLGRDPLEAIHISSRACGVCGGVHATTSAMALEMAYGIAPPPLAIIARDLGEAAELLYDHTLHLFLLAGPDYSAAVVRATSPTLWEAAQRAPAPSAEVHGLRTIADLMRGLDALSGPLYLEALDITRAAREVASLMLGKYPHPSTIFPGGIGIEATPQVFNAVLGRIVRLMDYAKRVALIWDDLVGFMLEVQPEQRRVGARPANLISTGIWDDPDAYTGRYADANTWGEARLSTPGVMVDGELRTTKLDLINAGIEEFVDRSYYSHWEGHQFPTDPGGVPLSPYHPWNKRTIPDPARRSWKERYTWSTAPRWDREAMESGPLARHWITARAGLISNEFITASADGLRIELPKGETPPLTLDWRIPERPNALERNRARAFHVAYCSMVAYTFLLRAFEHLRRGRTAMATPFTPPREAIGVGFWEAGRGTLTHHLVIEAGRIANYQIVTPSTWMASPEDPFGRPGPYEEAVLNTPILEEFGDPAAFQGIDILRTIRSFDPCMPCTVHLYAGDLRLVRDATTCLCGSET